MSTPADWFDDQVRRDDERVNNIVAGEQPVGQVEQLLSAFRDDIYRQPLPHVSGWIEDMWAPSGWRWVEDLAAPPEGAPAVDPDQMPPEHQHSHGGEG